METDKLFDNLKNENLFGLLGFCHLKKTDGPFFLLTKTRMHDMAGKVHLSLNSRKKTPQLLKPL